MQHIRQPKPFKRSLHRRIKPRIDPGQNSDTEIVVHSCKIGVRRGHRFAVLGRLDGLGHAFAENKLGENEGRNQPVQADLLGRVALDGTKPIV